MSGLHEADFAGPALRVLYVLCGLDGAAVIATGLVLWVQARMPAPGVPLALGLRLVRGLNLGTLVGLLAGIAAYFLANRLLSLELSDRACCEVRAFFDAWLATAAMPAILTCGTARRSALAAAGLLYLGDSNRRCGNRAVHRHGIPDLR
ncbi:PepSY domain-containing protein [Methylobacterium trifolii]|uniref:Uncharacterized protein n=1 Tax=Methylobacterium trifolii TaxID=1003092 RepID=A0ABQ4TXS7_9HYPH|nr:PepSY-associated TM helix domain-containing protein [Methylobacterium trifolii]GJE58793.1 hypothetical protein MPOCJGCO_0877 [Methylobacterium trifolii]